MIPDYFYLTFQQQKNKKSCPTGDRWKINTNKD
jgi:hypothetical protein